MQSAKKAARSVFAANALRFVATWGSWGTAPTEEIEELDRIGGVVALACAQANLDRQEDAAHAWFVRRHILR